MTKIDWTKPCSYDAAQKRAFHLAARKRLKALAVELGFAPDSYDLRSNEAGIAVSGEITLHHTAIYIQVSQSCMGAGSGILIRTCKGRRDYTGGSNRFAPLSMLDDLAALAARVRLVMEPAAEKQTDGSAGVDDTASAETRPLGCDEPAGATASAGGPKTWTVRCVAHLPTVNMVEVEAATLEEACEKAIAAANDSPHWETADQSEQTFIDTYCEGACDSDAEILTRLKSDVPYAFSEDGLRKRPTIKIWVVDGVVQDMTCDGAAIVIVHDADNEAEAPSFDPYEHSEYRFP